jgi:hypothetical protein
VELESRKERKKEGGIVKGCKSFKSWRLKGGHAAVGGRLYDKKKGRGVREGGNGLAIVGVELNPSEVKARHRCAQERYTIMGAHGNLNHHIFFFFFSFILYEHRFLSPPPILAGSGLLSVL